MKPATSFRFVAIAFLLALAACDKKSSSTPMAEPKVGQNPNTNTTPKGGENPVATPKDAEGWIEFQIPEAGGSVMLPKTPYKNKYPSKKDGVAYLASVGNVEFNVIVFTPVLADGETVEKALDAHLAKNTQDDNVEVKEIHSAGLPARGYKVIGRVGEKKEVAWEDRIIAVGAKWVILRANGADREPAATKKFFDSFKAPKS